ncbi:MAG: phosphocholine cytidylyltransferase family protein [Pseudomonadota bacterium]
MHAIILAAGIGNRLGNHANNLPKSLLEFAGKSLLHRHIELLFSFDINTIHIITGYQQESVMNHVADLSGDIRFIQNPRYTEGSLISLGCAKDILLNQPEFILMDADVLYEKSILKKLIDSQHNNCLLIDYDFVAGDEPVKICINNEDQIIEFRKQVAPGLPIVKQGESVGFFKFNRHVGRQLMEHIEHFLSLGKNDTPYEEAIRACILSTPEQFAYEDITGLPWIEIDFPEDMIRAREEILPQIDN